MNEGKKNIKEKIFAFIRPLWMWIRKISPKGTYLQLGNYRVKDRTVPKIDRLFGRTRNKIDILNYEVNCISALRKHVKYGDQVTIVGGGYGITGIVAMEKGGVVTLIEPSKARVNDILETWKQYNLKGTVIHGFVGSVISIWGDLNGAGKIDTLPNCDILELDCEGAEKEILSKLNIEPRIIVVESHGHLGSPSSLVKSLLISKGYRISDEMVENLENDIIVIVGENNKVQK